RANWLERGSDMVASTLAPVVRLYEEAREPDFSCAHAVDRGAGRTCSGGFHRIDRTRRFANLSCWRSAVAAIAGALGRIADDGLSVVQIFSRRTWQRRSADQGRTVRARRIHFAGHDPRKILLHLRYISQRHSTRTRRSLGASGRRFGFVARTQAGA